MKNFSDQLGVTDSVKLANIQNILQDALISTNNVSTCALLRLNGKVIATSNGFKLNKDQIENIVSAITDINNIRDGIDYDNDYYLCSRADSYSIYASCKSKGLIIVKTNCHILFATYSDNMFPAICIEAVETLAEYMKSKGK